MGGMSNNTDQSTLDVDVRFLLANERTLLAWLRTGLALIAGGVALAFLATASQWGAWAGMGAIAFGGTLGFVGFLRYKVADKAIRHGELPPSGMGEVVAIIVVAVFAGILLAISSLGL